MIEVGKEYYVVSRDYYHAPLMTKVIVSDVVAGSVAVFSDGKEGEEIFLGYVDENDLLSAEEIIKVWHHHRMMVDSFERHG